MTDIPDFGNQDSNHLIERAARRLRDAGHADATGLLPASANSVDHPAVVHASTTVRPRPRPIEEADGGEAFRPEQPAIGEPHPVIDQATLESAGMVDWTKQRQRLSEEFRIIQGQLVRAMAGNEATPNGLSNVVMITSARPGEGKTFTAMNLAGSLARYASRPVILVDCDSSRHSLSTLFKLDNVHGLLDIALDPALRIETTLRPTSMGSLRFLPIGGLAGARAVLSAGTPITDAVERLARQFSKCIVVLDAPPCLSSSDPSNLAHLIGQIIMLVEAQKTQRAELEAALDLVDACPAVSLILTKVKLTASDTFGAYGYY